MLIPPSFMEKMCTGILQRAQQVSEQIPNVIIRLDLQTFAEIKLLS